MKTLVVFDTAYGNTEEIGRAIGGGISGEVTVMRAREVSPDDLDGLDLLVVGSPTQAGRPLPETQAFLKNAAAACVKDVKVAAFDTRVSPKWVGIFGYAAGRIARSLKKAGGNLIVPPEPFFVDGKEGPLKAGELERAAEWGKKIAG